MANLPLWWPFSYTLNKVIYNTQANKKQDNKTSLSSERKSFSQFFFFSITLTLQYTASILETSTSHIFGRQYSLVVDYESFGFQGNGKSESGRGNVEAKTPAMAIFLSLIWSHR